TRIIEGQSRWESFSSTARHDFLHAGGWLVLGGMTAATLQVVVPRTVLDTIGGNEVLAVAAMATLAVVLAICSEADAFVAVGLTQFSMTSRLVFLVVGPVVDIKLVALQAGVFGRAFALRFAPAALVVAVAVAVVTGMVML
ncbi:MAG TPA: permease, partial [Egibacteraceae bacterium]|nr:permease [Egibacteraceae bacterium]